MSIETSYAELLASFRNSKEKAKNPASEYQEPDGRFKPDKEGSRFNTCVLAMKAKGKSDASAHAICGAIAQHKLGNSESGPKVYLRQSHMPEPHSYDFVPHGHSAVFDSVHKIPKSVKGDAYELHPKSDDEEDGYHIVRKVDRPMANSYAEIVGKILNHGTSDGVAKSWDVRHGENTIGTTKSGKAIPSHSHAVYEGDYKARRKDDRINVLGPAMRGSGSGRVLRGRLPGWSKGDHEDAARAHQAAANHAKEEWPKVQEAAHQETFGTKPGFHDYRVSGVGREEYSASKKDQLRRLAHDQTYHSDAAQAHWEAAGHRGLIKNSESDELGVLFQFAGEKIANSGSLDNKAMFVIPQDGWIQIAPKSDKPFPHPSGAKQLIDDKSVNAMAENFKNAKEKNPNFAVHVDADHRSDSADDTKACAWLTNLEARPDGLWGKAAWTEEGEKNINGGNFRYTSPVFLRSQCEKLEDGIVRPLVLNSCALTNTPNLKGMTPIVKIVDA